MRLCFIADGRDIHTQRWAQYFAERNHGVFLITYDPMGLQIEGVTEYVLKSPVKNLYLSFWFYHLQIMRLVRRINPDLIHAHFIAKYGFHLPLLGFHPSIVSAWGDDILILPKRSALINYFTKKVLLSVDLVYAVSMNLKNHIIQDFKVSTGKVTYLPIGVDTSFFPEKKVYRNNNCSVLTIFSNRKFSSVYDIESLIQGFYLAFQRERALRLILKGDGPEEKKLKNLVKTLHLDEVVTFKKRTGYSEIPHDLVLADIFITTAISDGTPVSLLEAMASGLPCIATNVGGIPEWITDGENGVLISPRDPSQIAEKILMLAASPDKRTTLGKKARETVVERAEWTEIMNTVETDYKCLIEKYQKRLT